MIEKIIQGIVLAIVCFVVYYLVGLVVAAAGLPIWIALVIGVILALLFCAWLLRAFGISF